MQLEASRTLPYLDLASRMSSIRKLDGSKDILCFVHYSRQSVQSASRLANRGLTNDQVIEAGS